MTSLKPTTSGMCLWGGIGGLSLLMLLVMCAAPGCSGSDASTSTKNQSASKGSPRVETVPVKTRDIDRTIEMPGTVIGEATVDLYAKVGGYLKALHVDIGDDIKKGQTLAELDIPEMVKELAQKEAEVARAVATVEQMQAAIRQAEAAIQRASAMIDEAKSARTEAGSQLEYRRAEHRRISKLVERSALQGQLLDESVYQLEVAQAGVQTGDARIRTAEAALSEAEANLDRAKRDLQTARASVQVAEAQRDRIEALLGYSTIVAPFDGVVTKRYVDAGAFIQPADSNSDAAPLLSVARVDHVRIFLDLPMAEVQYLQRGDRAIFDRINVLPEERIEGTVTRFAEALDGGSRMMRVEIDLPNPDRKLRPGYYGYVKLLLEEYKQIPIVPASAITMSEGEAYVYVVSNGVAEKRRIESAHTDGVIVGVGSGLSGGEDVVRAGVGGIRDGQPVSAIRVAQRGGRS